MEPSKSEPKKSGKEVVLVTGAAGFLGQHLIRELQEGPSKVSKIIAFDKLPFFKQLDYEDRVPVEKIQCDVCNTEGVMKALRGVTAVIHAAVFRDVSLFPNDIKLRQINIEGTINLIAACLENGVKSFIYTSSIEAVVTDTPIVNMDESAPYPSPSQLLFRAYGSSKQRAEHYVLACNESEVIEGCKLHTVALRPCILYGEKDPRLIEEAYRNKKFSRRFYGNTNNISLTYAGNAAWAHVCAFQTLMKPKTRNKIAGQAFFIVDDTPLRPIENLYQTIVSPKEADEEKRWAFMFFFYLLSVIQFLLWVIGPIYEFKMQPTRKSIMYVSADRSFNGGKAMDLIDYIPKYDYKTSLSKSIAFFNLMKASKSD